MRDEITEPKHWMSDPSAQSYSARRRAAGIPLPAEVVDAAFDEDAPLAVSPDDEPRTYPELVARIHVQLAVLEAQRVQLQKLLSQAGDVRS
jgi:hypothetical protein